jgi:ubiquinone/menaquinone biosynthesis C-methylase UbiE
VNGSELDKKIDQQRAHYASIAGEFDQKYNRENSNHYYKIEQIERAFDQYLPPSSEGWDLMEIGAGSGIHAQHVIKSLGSRIRSFVLSDLSAEMLELAKTRMGDSQKINYVVSPAEEILLDRKFDGIYISGSMHHFSDYRRAISAARNQLKSRGVLVVCEPNVWNPVNLVKALKDYSLEVGQFSVTRNNIRKTLSEEGFEILSSRVLHFRSNNKLAGRLYPYERLETLAWLDFLAIMFLLVARVKEDCTG